MLRFLTLIIFVGIVGGCDHSDMTAFSDFFMMEPVRETTVTPAPAATTATAAPITALSPAPVVPKIIDKNLSIEFKPVKDLSYTVLQDIAARYATDAKSPLYLYILYNPDHDRARLSAFNRLSILKGQLAKLGIQNIETGLREFPITQSQGAILYHTKDTVLSEDKIMTILAEHAKLVTARPADGSL